MRNVNFKRDKQRKFYIDYYKEPIKHGTTELGYYLQTYLHINCFRLKNVELYKILT